MCSYDGLLCRKISEDFDEGLGGFVRYPECFSVSVKGRVRVWSF